MRDTVLHILDSFRAKPRLGLDPRIEQMPSVIRDVAERRV